MKVIAIESCKNGVLRSYGTGKLLNDMVPDCEPFNKFKIKNPCIKLDSGKYVWGFQCWWGDEERVRKEYDGVKEIIIEIEDEVKPVELFNNGDKK